MRHILQSGLVIPTTNTIEIALRGESDRRLGLGEYGIGYGTDQTKIVEDLWGH